MTKEDILHHFQDINFYYGDCMMYADLSGMLDELIAENKAELIDDVKSEIDKAQEPYQTSTAYDEGVRFGLMLAYQIVDRYKAESEETSD